MNWIQDLFPSLLSLLGRGKPEIEKPIKVVLDIVGALPIKELETNIEQIDVREAQEKLTELGYDVGPADGFPGPVTQAAVKKYQEDKGLIIDGLIGQQTWKSLMA